MKINLLILISFLSFYSCKQKTEAVAANTTAQNGLSSEAFGAATDANGAISVADALSSLKNNDTLNCKVSGYVTSVCQMKGCWMMLSQNPDDSTGLFVKFKDYAFFMPKDLSGSKVVANGFAFKEITSVDELKHYAEDEGKTKEEIAAINAPKEEMKFMAEGVVVVDRKHNGQ